MGSKFIFRTDGLGPNVYKAMIRGRDAAIKDGKFLRERRERLSKKTDK